MDTLVHRMGVQPTLPVKVSVTIDIMLNLEDDFDEHSDHEVTCKQTLTLQRSYRLCLTRLVSRTLLIVTRFVLFRDAWSKLGNMSSEEAMVKYVDELKTVGFRITRDG